jgi:curved DNA-binding protein CbpA
MSLYDDLGISSDASEAQITAAYRSAARRHHPDAGGTAEDFDRVQRAANVLRDPVKRAEYDRTGTVDDRVADPLAQAIDLLCSGFTEAIGRSENLGMIDLVADVRRNLKLRLTYIASQREQTVAGRTRLESALARLTYRGDRPDFVGNVLKSQLRNHDTRLAEMDEMAASIARAIDMADDYSWSAGPEPEDTFRELAQDAIAWDELVR